MTKADNIRKALTAVSPGGLTYAQLADKTGIPVKKLGPNLAAFTQRGEITTKADGEGVTRYHINLDYNKSAGGGARFAQGQEARRRQEGAESRNGRQGEAPFQAPD